VFRFSPIRIRYRRAQIAFGWANLEGVVHPYSLNKLDARVDERKPPQGEEW
jgi:hypothetical protein